MRKLEILSITTMLSSLLPGCTGSDSPVSIYYGDDLQPALSEFIRRMDTTEVAHEARRSPAGHARRARGLGVSVVLDLDDCTECYTITENGHYTIRASDRLGAQYGLAALFEALGVRFYHPHATYLPDTFSEPMPSRLELDTVISPEMSLRGLQPHTLHPIEGYFDLWEPSEANLDSAKQIIDWLIKNRGNHLQWPALDNILNSTSERRLWAEHTQEIVDYGHERGITLGLGIQLFGGGNLQQAFDLLDELGSQDASHEEMERRLGLLATVEGLDMLNLSFGEFSGEDPETFVETINQAYDAMQSVIPGIEGTNLLHVGNYDDLQVEYNGEEMLYYFLAQFADPAMVPHVHTVMYYNLFEDAGGAYLHDEFDEHRDFLFDRMARNQRVAYFPESAYWVAFDINVPTYLPLYVRSRFHDLDQIRATANAMGYAQLTEHVLFSSGWEWGYWQNDYAVLRMNYSLPDSYKVLFHEMFSPYGEAGALLADSLVHLTDVQHEYLIQRRLAAYLAGRENIIDLGDNLGILSQPDRPSFSEIQAMTEADRTQFELTVLADLAAFTDELEKVNIQLNQLPLESDPFFDEIIDGVMIDISRTKFAHAAFSGAVNWAKTGDAAEDLSRVRQQLAEAESIVQRRHLALHDPRRERLITDGENATIYNFGYLKRADELCFWRRELIQLERLTEGSDESVPPCSL